MFEKNIPKNFSSKEIAGVDETKKVFCARYIIYKIDFVEFYL